MFKNTDYIKANAFAFYSLNESNFIDFKESSKAENICEFLEEIVDRNKEKIIILILDNSRAHRAYKTVSKARDLRVVLILLPPYSPDLNPLGLVWKTIKKTIKREVSVRLLNQKNI